MSADHSPEPWSGATYHGFSGPPRRAPEPAAPVGPRPRASRRTLLGAGVAIAVALGLAIGLALRPDSRALSTDAQEATVAPRVPIEVNRPAPLPAPRSAGKLEVLSPSAAEVARPAWTTAPARQVGAAPPQPAVASSAPISPRLTQVPPAPIAIAPEPTAAPAPVRDACAGAHSRAEAMICGDRDLAAADRDLNRAYRRALRSGAVSPEDLRADQRDWLDIREQAAGRSPRAVADLYERRIDELNRIADDGPG